jgi:hypothetical protein
MCGTIGIYQARPATADRGAVPRPRDSDEHLPAHQLNDDITTEAKIPRVKQTPGSSTAILGLGYSWTAAWNRLLPKNTGEVRE